MEKMMKKVTLYVLTDKVAGIDCSLDTMLNEMEIVDWDIEDLDSDELETFEI